VTEVPARGLDVTLVADERVRARLAAANGLPGIASAEARLHVSRRGREGVHVDGEVRARATLTCVVSLERFEADIVEPVDVDFEPSREPRPARDAQAPGRPRRGVRPEPEPEDEPGMEDLDAPDPIIDGRIDLGALAEEFLTLGIDPYPRKPGVAFAEPAEPPARENPFAKLATFAPKSGDKK
jgi:hypothetical protein